MRAPREWDESMDALAEEICARIRQGVVPKVACVAMGINERRYEEWEKLAAENPESTYSTFYAKCRQAEMESQMEMTLELRAFHKGTHPQRAQSDTLIKTLAKRWPEDWGDKKQLTIDTGKSLGDLAQLQERWLKSSTKEDVSALETEGFEELDEYTPPLTVAMTEEP